MRQLFFIAILLFPFSIANAFHLIVVDFRNLDEAALKTTLLRLNDSLSGDRALYLCNGTESRMYKGKEEIRKAIVNTSFSNSIKQPGCSKDLRRISKAQLIPIEHDFLELHYFTDLGLCIKEYQLLTLVNSLFLSRKNATSDTVQCLILYTNQTVLNSTFHNQRLITPFSIYKLIKP